MLSFKGQWRFESPSGIPSAAVHEIDTLIRKISVQADRKTTIEHFKDYFGRAAGMPVVHSSSVSWAETDLQHLMNEAAQNAPLFIEAFFDACESLREQGLNVPDVTMVNAILAKHKVGYSISLPNLIRDADSTAPIPVQVDSLSLDEQAQELIQNSLRISEELRAAGKHRQAVQEVLWLMETVSTAFQGMDVEDNGTVKGKYFKKIVEDLQRFNRGKASEHVLAWVTTLYGFLSAPTGGGIRHGAKLGTAIATDPIEAKLYCNLIRSYIMFLIDEHGRLSKSAC